MTYSKELAIVAPDLDKGALAVALHRKDHMPLELTERDFDQLAIVAPDLETEAREAQRQAQLAIVAQHRATTADDDEGLVPFLRKYGKAPIRSELLADILDGLIQGLQQRDAKIAGLEHEVASLKARPLQKWAGVHVTGTQYAEASLVTKGGSLWVATTATTTTPGDAGGAWRLIVKRGDAR